MILALTEPQLQGTHLKHGTCNEHSQVIITCEVLYGHFSLEGIRHGFFPAIESNV